MPPRQAQNPAITNYYEAITTALFYKLRLPPGLENYDGITTERATASSQRKGEDGIVCHPPPFPSPNGHPKGCESLLVEGSSGTLMPQFIHSKRQLFLNYGDGDLYLSASLALINFLLRQHAASVKILPRDAYQLHFGAAVSTPD